MKNMLKVVVLFFVLMAFASTSQAQYKAYLFNAFTGVPPGGACDGATVYVTAQLTNSVTSSFYITIPSGATDVYFEQYDNYPTYAHYKLYDTTAGTSVCGVVGTKMTVDTSHSYQAWLYYTDSTHHPASGTVESVTVDFDVL